NVLEGIVEAIVKRPEISFHFVKPVSKKEYPDYHTKIRHPMDLLTIKERTRKMEYRSRDEFRHDVYQITYNAHVY
ncbi:hypothetical protein M569_04283, partial [Genlisea aurea]